MSNSNDVEAMNEEGHPSLNKHGDDEEPKPYGTQSGSSSKKKYIIIAIILACLIGLGVGLAIFFTSDDDSSSKQSSKSENNNSDRPGGAAGGPPSTPTPTIPGFPIPPPTIAGTPSPTVEKAGEYFNIIEDVAYFGGNEFDDTSSYQSKALRWVQTLNLPSSSSNLSLQDEVIQLYALACIFFNTNGVTSDWTDFHYGEDQVLPGWVRRRGWVDTTDVCTWHGLECNASGFVEKIDLNENGLTGYLPPETTLLADSLKSIDLFRNILHNEGDEGNAFLGKLTNLEQLFFGQTSFDYDGIPTELGLLTNLRELDFSYTLYFGALNGETFSKLTNLEYLAMSGNAYDGPLPAGITSLPNLQYLYASFSHLSGMDLNFVPQMPSIKELWIDDNPEIGGTIPTALGTMPGMQSFSCTNCGLTGNIPSELGLLQAAPIRIWLYDNKLTGNIPDEVASIAGLEVFQVQKNQLTGAMPSGMCRKFNSQFGRLEELVADCAEGNVEVDCDCCTCCGEDCIPSLQDDDSRRMKEQIR